MNIGDRNILTIIARKVMEGDSFTTAFNFYSANKTTMEICNNLPRWRNYKKLKQMVRNNNEDYSEAIYKGLKGDNAYVIYNISKRRGYMVRGSFEEYDIFNGYIEAFERVCCFDGKKYPKLKKMFLTIVDEIFTPCPFIDLFYNKETAIVHLIKDIEDKEESNKVRDELEERSMSASGNNLYILELDVLR